MKCLKIEHLLELVSSAARGIDKIEEGAVGSNDYGFVFKAFDYNSISSFIIGDGSSKFCSIGAFKHILNESLRDQDIISRDLEELCNYDPKLDLHFGGALKTLIPDIEFGGYECLFEA